MASITETLLCTQTVCQYCWMCKHCSPKLVTRRWMETFPWEEKSTSSWSWEVVLRLTVETRFHFTSQYACFDLNAYTCELRYYRNIKWQTYINMDCWIVPWTKRHLLTLFYLNYHGLNTQDVLFLCTWFSKFIS